MKFKHCILILGLIMSLSSCYKEDYSQYIDNENPNKVELENLIPLLEKHQTYSENRFTIMSQIISKMRNQETPSKLNLLVTTYISENPNDPYNSYYILSLASAYLKNEQVEFAIPYLQKVIMEYTDLTIRDESTHLKALETLIGISEIDIDKVYYYRRLIEDHYDNIDPQVVYYNLGKTLEQCEQWDEAIKAYENYLEFPISEDLKEAEKREAIITKVGFYYSEKTWIENDLDYLVSRVKYAIYKRNPVLLDKYRAFDFFIINWKSKYSELKSSFPMESYVLTNMSIKTANNLDSMSNEKEAYLAVSGNPWTSSIWYVYPTWYFYFRQVDYPQDPEIHGGWEWAGIYLGEKL